VDSGRAVVGAASLAVHFRSLFGEKWTVAASRRAIGRGAA
jgi:hypothetical protein